MPKRAPYRRRFPVNRKPSLQHQREPLAPLPLPGCKCDACENARTDTHWARVGELLGIDEQTDEKGEVR